MDVYQYFFRIYQNIFDGQELQTGASDFKSS